MNEISKLPREPNVIDDLPAMIRKLSREIWFECQSRTLCKEEIADIERAVSDLDAALRASTDAHADKHERAA